MVQRGDTQKINMQKKKKWMEKHAKYCISNEKKNKDSTNER